MDDKQRAQAILGPKPRDLILGPGKDGKKIDPQGVKADSFTPEQKAKGKVDYNYTMQEFPSDEGPGASVFYKDPATGEIFHTYSTYGRGLDSFVGTYTLLDLVPKGRDEDPEATMSWVRYHDRYDQPADVAAH